MSQSNQIAIVTDDPGWHGRQLRSAFSDRGFESDYVSLMDCHFSIQNQQTQIHIPGFDPERLVGVFVRGIPGGTLEQVILRLNVLHSLDKRGIVVYNTGCSIERTVDKTMTSFLLNLHGLPVPDTWICESETFARSVITEQCSRGHLLVIKPIFGSQGIGLKKIADPDELPHDPEIYGGVYYLQRFLPRMADRHQDWRVFVINGRAEAMMLRTGDHWITNRAQGAKCVAIAYDHHLAELAEAAVRAVDIDYAGVDLMQDEKGNFLITEVNSVPAWWGLQKICDFNLAERLVDHMLSKIATIRQINVLN